MMFKRKTIWILLILWIVCSACGYRFVGSGSFPAGVKAVSINIFENRTAETGVENTITNDLIYEVTRDKNVVLTGKDKADAILSGVVASMQIVAVSHRDPQTSIERRVVVSVDLKLAEPGGRIIWSAKGVSEREAYDVDPDKQVTEQNRREAISTLSKRLAENIYNRLTEDF